MAEEMPYSSSLPDFGRFPWDDLYPRLLLAALGRLSPAIWRGERRGQVPGGRTAHDAVQTAVEKFLGGERQWNRSKSAFENLWGAVSSEISNWATSAENRTTSRTDGGCHLASERRPVGRPPSAGPLLSKVRGLFGVRYDFHKANVECR